MTKEPLNEIPYQLRLVFLAICIFVVFPGTLSVYALIIALAWCYIRSIYGVLTGY
jgi:hypothetical protein